MILEKISKLQRSSFLIVFLGTKLMECSDRAGLCSVYRTLAEIWIQEEKKSKAIRLLCSLVDYSIDPLADDPLEESNVEDCVEKFEELSRKILQEQTVRRTIIKL